MAFLKLKAAVGELGIEYYKLREWAVAGEIPAFRTGGDKGTWMIDVDQVREALLKKAQ